MPSSSVNVEILFLEPLILVVSAENVRSADWKSTGSKWDVEDCKEEEVGERSQRLSQAPSSPLCEAKGNFFLALFDSPAPRSDRPNNAVDSRCQKLFLGFSFVETKTCYQKATGGWYFLRSGEEVCGAS